MVQKCHLISMLHYFKPENIYVSLENNTLIL